MARIIPLLSPRHRDIRLLLPWYATGGLSELEHARVEAHLGTCAACQAELQTDLRLREAIVGLPFETEAGWARLRARIASQDARGLAAMPAALRRLWRAPAWVAWALAGQAALVAAAVLLFPVLLPPARYETLGAAAGPPTAEIIVVFRPDTSERDLRAALNAADVRLVGGPTATDAYLLDAGAAGRDAALAALRRRPEVTLAEPLVPAATGGGAP